MSDQRPDIIIIGGGSAGLEIARIASRAGQKITLLEDGLPKGRHVMQRVPLLVGKIIANLRFVSHDKTLPQKGLRKRILPLILGRGLGGSSRINGNVADAGPMARYEACFPFWSPADIAAILLGLDRSGECQISRQDSWTDGLTKIFLEHAAKDFPNSDPFFKARTLSVHTKRGLRFNHFDGYRLTANHANITLIQDAKVTRLSMDGARVTGVTYLHGGQSHKLAADQIVLAAGVVQSPLILMRSGIGDRVVLEQAKITCQHNLLHVGKHLKDHPNIRIPFAAPGHNTLNQKTRGLAAMFEGVKFILGFKNTVVRGPGASAGVNISLKDQLAVRLQLVHFTQDRSCISDQGIQFERGQKASIGFSPLWPRSEGSITLDANAAPLIDPAFLTDPQDLIMAKAGLAAAYQLIKSMGFTPDDEVPAHEQEQFLRDGAYSGYHLLGSNRMAQSEKIGVVGPDFGVFGLSGLYVVDASVMPDQLSSHSYLPTIALARLFAHQKGWKAAI
ncbi:MAG: GMC family oxidoreductase [Paracoccaceae bacterium]